MNGNYIERFSDVQRMEVEILSAFERQALLCIVAPTGHGKTVLAQQFAEYGGAGVEVMYPALRGENLLPDLNAKRIVIIDEPQLWKNIIPILQNTKIPTALLLQHRSDISSFGLQQFKISFMEIESWNSLEEEEQSDLVFAEKQGERFTFKIADVGHTIAIANSRSGKSFHSLKE